MEGVGVEPTDRITTVYGLAIRCITVLPAFRQCYYIVNTVRCQQEFGSDGRTRTNHTQIFSLLLYLMSYVAINWCRRQGLNLRPMPYQDTALPLSYGGIFLEEAVGFEPTDPFTDR